MEIYSDEKDKDGKDEKEDPSLKQKEKQANMMKKRVLLQKLRAVRSGAGAESIIFVTWLDELIDEVV